MKSMSMEKKKKTNMKRKKEDGSGANSVATKLQKVKEIARNTVLIEMTKKLSASSGDFSPKDEKMKKSARPMSADVLRSSPVRQILTSKSEVNTSNINPSNKNPIPRLEPLPEETELKRVNKKRKASMSPNGLNHSPNRLATRVVASPNQLATTVVTSPNRLATRVVTSPKRLATRVVTSPKRLATRVVVSPNRLATRAFAKVDSRSPKRPRKQGSPTKIGSPKATGRVKSGAKDSNVVPFSEIVRTRFPLLTDDELVKRFQCVTMTNNQKGRIRQTLKGIFEGTTSNILPDIIYNKIQHILQSKETLTDSDLRKIRVLYNMLKVATEIEMKNAGKCSLASSLKKDSVIKKSAPDSFLEVKPVQTQEVQVSNRRYVVFIGNLPLDVDKDQLLSHFDELRQYIKDVRIPPAKEGKKNAIAYLELHTEPAFEMALSKHHTMFCNRRINVLYSKQQNSKMSKADAKAKAAKMVALVKSGHLIGSLPLKKKRSHRRAIMKQAQKEANDHALMLKAQ